MGILNLAALWMAWTIPVLVALYLLKLRRQDRVIPSILLWQKMLRDTRANAPFQKLRRNLLLLLQLLVLLAVLAALARPYIQWRQGSVSRRIIVLDTSASMQATDVQPTRFEAARAGVRDLIDAMRGGEELMLIEAGGRTRIASSFTSDRGALRAALDKVVVEDAAGDLAEAASLAISVGKTQRECEVLFFSDGSNANLAGLQTAGLPAQFVRFGESGDNVGITAMEVRSGRGMDRRPQVFLTVVNFSAEPKVVDLGFYLDGTLIETRNLALEPGMESRQLLQRPAPESGILEARLEVEDALSVDDRAWAILYPGRTVRVLLASRQPDPFLERILLLDPRVDLSRVEMGLYDPAISGFDLHVLKGFSPPAPPSANTLLVAAQVVEWAAVQEVKERPLIVDWNRNHPVTRFCQFDGISLESAVIPQLPAWGEPLVESQEGAVIWAGQNGIQRIVSVGFDPLQSNWPLRVSYILFFENALSWMDVVAQADQIRHVRAGQVARFQADAGVPEVVVSGPDGFRRRLEVGSDRTVLLSDTMRSGVYRIEGMDEPWVFCINTLSRVESAIQPGEKIDFGRHSELAAGTVQPAMREVWRWFILCALLVISFEWWVFHRRAWV